MFINFCQFSFAINKYYQKLNIEIMEQDRERDEIIYRAEGLCNMNMIQEAIILCDDYLIRYPEDSKVKDFRDNILYQNDIEY